MPYGVANQGGWRGVSEGQRKVAAAAFSGEGIKYLTERQIAAYSYKTVVVVVPNRPEYQLDSYQERGVPASHFVNPEDGSRTLCGRDPEGWDFYSYGVEREFILDEWESGACKTCLKQLKRMLGPA